MANWLTYIKERFPLPVYFLLVGGFSLSGNLLAAGKFASVGLLLAFTGNMIFFFTLRLMDEYKDYKKDLIIHPERPIPRGLLKPDQVLRSIYSLIGAMAGFGALLFAINSSEAAVAYWVTTVWLWLMFKEFYLGEWLANRPLLYAITHQIIIYPVAALGILVHNPDMWNEPQTWFYATAVLGAFFSYEVCRKLDPKAHELQKTYLAVYGPVRTLIILIVLNLMAAGAAFASGLKYWLWPLEALLILSFFIVMAKPEKYKVAEAAATLSLLFHIWGVAFAYFWHFGF